MAEIIGAVSAVAGLISEAITLIRLVQQASKRVNGATKALIDISTQLSAVSTSLVLIREEPRLQVMAVEEQVQIIVGIHEELKRFFDRLEAKQTKSKLGQFARALKDGDGDDNELGGMASRLDSARGELTQRIVVVNVGLTGNLDDGFVVAKDVLMEINDNVKQTLGIQLALAERVWDMQTISTSTALVRLEDRDIDALGLRDQNLDQARQVDSGTTESENLKWHNNRASDDATILGSNLGYDAAETQKLAPVKASVTNSEFGKGLRFVAGHVGPAAAQNFFGRS